MGQAKHCHPIQESGYSTGAFRKKGQTWGPFTLGCSAGKPPSLAAFPHHIPIALRLLSAAGVSAVQNAGRKHSVFVRTGLHGTKVDVVARAFPKNGSTHVGLLPSHPVFIY